MCSPGDNEMTSTDAETRMVHTQIYDSGNLGISMGDKPSVITVELLESDGVTLVRTTITYASKTDRDMSIESGMTDGMEMSYTQLDKVLTECS